MRFDDGLKHVLAHEGGFVEHPNDPGGATNLGVTKETWERWVGHGVSVDAIRALTVADVTPVYREKYWDRAKCGALPVGIDYCVFDTAVNSGPGRAVKFLQEVVGSTPDGVIGPLTLRAVHVMNPRDVIDRYCGLRLEFLAELPTWPTFGRGWRRRVDEVRRTAQEMLAAS
ncbi:MAG: glycoside hydrolase family 108 protein [Candidatus Limnocylindrus sp.]